MGEAIEVIYETFDGEVMRGQVTFEQFLDWIRSIEPKEIANAVEETVQEEKVSV
jgi:hypothetical protein